MDLKKTLRQQHAACQKELPRDSSIQDLCENSLLPADSVHEVAAKAILHFGVTDGHFNNRLAVVTLALGFLEACTGHKRTEASMRDLKHTLDTSPTQNALQGWAVSHFP
jgi:hypothetical protein